MATAVVLVEGILVVALLLGALAHDESLRAPRRRNGRCVDMDRDEEVAARLVGDVGTGLQVVDLGGGQRLVALARINHFHAGHPLLDQLAQFQRHGQRQRLLVRAEIVRARIVAAVTRIDHHHLHAVGNMLGGRNVRPNGRDQSKQ